MNGMVSVVVACYNVKKYAEEAVRSVMEQTLRDIEIICVDDGSTDGTAACLDRLAQEDARIHVIHLPKNQGLLAVRHHGVAAANGDYIMFLDGDDRLDKRACEAALAVAEEKQVDVVQFATELLDTEGMTEDRIAEIYRATMPCTEPLSKAEGTLVEACYAERLFSWSVWAKLFRASCVKKAFQIYGGERLNVGEDMLICFQIFCFAKGYAPLCAKYHDYRQGSGMTSAQREFPVEKMQAYAEEYQVYTILNAWLETMHIREKHMRALRFVQKQVGQDAYYKLSCCVRKEDRPKAVQMLKTYWPMEELAVAMNRELYKELRLENKAEFVSALKYTEWKQVKPREIRTIGTFYYRLYNGGVERVISNLVPIWQEKGWRVVVFTEEINEKDYPLNEQVVRVVIPKIVGNSSESVEKRTRAWMDAIKKHHVDVMVYHNWVSTILTEEQIAIKAAGIPLVLHTHCTFSLGLGAPNLQCQMQAATQKKGYALFDAVVTLGEVDCAWWRALGYKTALALNPPTFDCRKIEPSVSAGRQILWVGRICAEKQPEEALRVMRIVHDAVPDARLTVVGMAENEEILRQITAYMNAYQMNEYVVMAGYQEDVAPYYRQAALVLWTSNLEGAPMAMAEAKAFGLPIVCYELPNVDMVREAKGMCVVRQKDAQGAAEHVIRLLKDDALRKRMGQESRRSAEEMSQTDIGEMWRSIFEMAMQPTEEERMVSSLPPMETAIHLATDDAEKGMRYRAGAVWADGDAGDNEELAMKYKALEDLYIDGYFVKAYMALNKLFPKGGKARERVKKLASCFIK